MSGISIGDLPNQSILKKINDIEADVKDLDLEGVNNLKSKLSELVAPELGSSDTKAISQKVVTENIEQLNTEVNNKINKVESAQNGNLPSFDNGHIKDSKIPASNIAQANGYYESMIVGASRNLAGNNIVTAKYTYRPTADTTDVADGVAKISSVKGNTIVWNQLVSPSKENWYSQPNIFESIIEDNYGKLVLINKEELNPNGGGVTIVHNLKPAIANHKYLIKGYVKTDKENKVAIRNYTRAFPPNGIGWSVIPTPNTWTKIAYIDSNTTNYNSALTINLAKTDILENGDTLEYRNIQLFDLTQMFGEGNEPTLEEFEAMFPADYYEYNEGELRSIEDFQIKSVGFNQWDEEYTNNRFSTSTGLDYTTTTNDTIASKNYIPIIGGKEYYNKYVATSGIWCVFFDNNKNIIETPNVGVDNLLRSNNAVLLKTIKYTAPKNACFMKFYFTNEYGLIYKNDFNINLSHSGIRDGEYEPYQEDILPINISSIKDENGEQLFPNGLCSAGEAHDELVYDKSLGKWKAVKRIGSVDMGSLNWYTGWYADSGRIYADIISKAVGRTNIIYPLGITTADDNKLINSVGICGNSQNTYIFIGQGATHTDSATFIASLNGIYAYYELAEPIEVVLDGFTSNYKVSDWGTEEILMNSTPIVPVIYDVEYALNAVDTLRNMPTNYISKESLDAFLSALGNAMGGTWTTAYNETNGRYDFSFSANATELIEE